MKRIKLFSVLIALFFITRLIDFTLVWNLGKLEHKYIQESEVYGKIEVEDTCCLYLGLSTKEKAEKTLMGLVRKQDKKDSIVMVSYFTLLKPTEYLIYCNGLPKNVIFPWAQLNIKKGITRVGFYKFDFFEIETDTKHRWQFAPFLGSMLSPFLHPGKMVTWYTDISKYFNLIHIFYFLFPLSIIYLFCRYYSKAVYISFWYFFIMLLLFASRSYWTCPFIFIFEKLLGYDGIPKLVYFIALVLNISIYYLFVKGIKIGKNISRNSESPFIEKVIISYFLLLPIFLRF